MQQEHTASRWHKNRARSIHKIHAESIKRYHRRLPWSLPLMLVLISAQFFIAALCATLNLGYVLLLSAIVGAFIAWGLHHYLHEISHHLLPGSTSVSWRSLLMHIGAMTFPDLSLFAYYRWQHMSHHNKLGESDIDEVLLAELVDADVLAVSRYYSHNEGSASDTVGAKLIGYKLFLMFNPLLEWVENTLVFLRHIVLIPHTFLCP